MRGVLSALFMDAAPFWAFASWVMALGAHALRQPKIRRLIGHDGGTGSGMITMLLLPAPLAGLVLCLAADAATGVLYWFGTLSLAGLVTALGLAIIQMRR